MVITRILFIILLIGVIVGMAGHAVHGIYMMPVTAGKSGAGGMITVAGNIRPPFATR